MKKNIKYLPIVLAIAAMAVACETEVPYEPGKSTAEDCMDVRFSPENDNEFLFTRQEIEDYSIDLKLIRENAAEAVDIPVEVIVAGDCISTEPVAHFDAGATETTVKVSFDGIPLYEQQDCYIKIPDEYVDLYKADPDGTGYYRASIIVSEWRKIVKDAEVFGDKNKNNYICDIYWLVGANRFKFTDFMESGIDITFRIDGGVFDADDTKTWAGYLTPLDNYDVRDASYTNSNAPEPHLYWYLFDDATGKRPTYYLASGQKVNGNMCFHSHLYYNEFNLINGNVWDYGEWYRGIIYKYNGGSEWVYFGYDPEQINLEGWPEEEGDDAETE